MSYTPWCFLFPLTYFFVFPSHSQPWYSPDRKQAFGIHLVGGAAHTFFFFLAFCQIFPLTSTHDSPDLVAVFSFLSAFTCLIVTLAFCTKAFLSYCTTPAFNGLLLMWSISGIISFGFSTRSVCLLPMGSSRTAREWYSCILFHAMRKVRYTNIHELFCVF